MDPQRCGCWNLRCLIFIQILVIDMLSVGYKLILWKILQKIYGWYHLINVDKSVWHHTMAWGAN